MYGFDRKIGNNVLTRTNDDSNTHFSDRYQQTYHSTFGARTESLHVFLHGSGIYNRLCEKQPTRVLEIGFGLGLNCLLCADCAETHSTFLSYTSIDHTLINPATFIKLNYGQWLNSPDLTNDLVPILKHLQAHVVLSANGSLGQYCELALHRNDATSPSLLKILQSGAYYDAIFLDAFSPEVNPECWTRTFFEQLQLILAPNGRLATYCVKGVVQRNLKKAGFTVNKYPGPAGKREVLWARPASSVSK